MSERYTGNKRVLGNSVDPNDSSINPLKKKANTGNNWSLLGGTPTGGSSNTSGVSGVPGTGSSAPSNPTYNSPAGSYAGRPDIPMAPDKWLQTSLDMLPSGVPGFTMGALKWSPQLGGNSGDSGNPTGNQTAGSTGSGPIGQSAVTQNMPKFEPQFEEDPKVVDPYGQTTHMNPKEFATRETADAVSSMIPGSRVGQADFTGGFNMSQPMRLIYGGVGGNHSVDAGAAAREIAQTGQVSGPQFGYYGTDDDVPPIVREIMKYDQGARNGIQVGGQTPSIVRPQRPLYR